MQTIWAPEMRKFLTSTLCKHVTHVAIVKFKQQCKQTPETWVDISKLAEQQGYIRIKPPTSKEKPGRDSTPVGLRSMEAPLRFPTTWPRISSRIWKHRCFLFTFSDSAIDMVLNLERKCLGRHKLSLSSYFSWEFFTSRCGRCETFCVCLFSSLGFRNHWWFQVSKGNY